MEMKLLGIESRDVYIAVEFGLAELQNIETFLKTVVPMYNQVYGDSDVNLTQEMMQFHGELESIIKHTKENMENGS